MLQFLSSFICSFFTSLSATLFIISMMLVLLTYLIPLHRKVVIKPEDLLK